MRELVSDCFEGACRKEERNRQAYEAVWLVEAICYDGETACCGLKAVDLLRDRGDGAEVLKVAVCRVGEPDVTGDGMLTGVVDGGVIPVAEVVVVDDCARVRCRIDGDEGGVMLEIALVAPELVGWWRGDV